MIRPHKLSRRHTLIALAIIGLALLGGIGLLLSRQWGAPSKNTPTPLVTPGHIAITGTIVCLPHKNTQGPQTLECAYGLQSDNGEYFGLRNLNQDQLIDGTFTISTKVQVSGELTPPGSDERYGVVGNIDVKDIKIISSAADTFEQFDTYLTLIPDTFREKL